MIATASQKREMPPSHPSPALYWDIIGIVGKEESLVFEGVATDRFPMFLWLVLHLDTYRHH